MARTLGRIESTDDRRAVATLLIEAFGGDRNFRDRLVETDLFDGPTRVLRDDHSILAAMRLLDMQQAFGGNWLRMGGINGVCASPEHRSAGVGRQIMEEVVREMHRDGYPISTLYAAAPEFYRSLGYGAAGLSCLARIDMARINVRPNHLSVRTLTPGDWQEANELHNSRVVRRDGEIARDEFYWRAWIQRHFDAHAGGAYAVVDDAGAMQGFVIFTQADRASHDAPRVIRVQSWAASDAHAADRVLAILGGYRMRCDSVELFTSVDDLLVQRVPDMQVRIIVRDVWMTRVVNVEAAVHERGINPHLRAEAHVELRDPLIESNSGRFVITGRDGRATIERGGDGAVTLGIDQFASVFAGYRDPLVLAEEGLIDADRDHARALAAMFAGTGVPGMQDRY